MRERTIRDVHLIPGKNCHNFDKFSLSLFRLPILANSDEKGFRAEITAPPVITNKYRSRSRPDSRHRDSTSMKLYRCRTLLPVLPPSLYLSVDQNSRRRIPEASSLSPSVRRRLRFAVWASSRLSTFLPGDRLIWETA